MEDINNELESLFDMLRLNEEYKDNNISPRIHSELINVPRVVLSRDGVQVIDEFMVSMYEGNNRSLTSNRARTSKLRVNLLRGCGRDEAGTEHYVMPSLRLDIVSKEYAEPLRNRDKNWKLDSQRHILNDEKSKSLSDLELGKYGSPKQPLLEWSPALKSLVRKNQLFQVAKVISDTHCFVRVFGLGISGRVFAPGGQNARLLFLEVYSVWNSQIYTLQIPGPSIKHLLLGQDQLFAPGKKLELLRALVDLLYFDYELIVHSQAAAELPDGFKAKGCEPVPQKDDLANEKGKGKGKGVGQGREQEQLEQDAQEGHDLNLDGSTSCASSDGSLAIKSLSSALLVPNENVEDHHKSSVTGENSKGKEEDKGEEVDSVNAPSLDVKHVHVHHITPFELPEGYPQNIADIIRNLSGVRSTVDQAKVDLMQCIKISPGKKENGPIVRRRDMLKRLKLEQEEEDRRRKEWMAIPKRLKGRFAGKAIRRNSRFFVLSCYRLPSRPSVMNVRGHVANECDVLSHNLDLKAPGRDCGIIIPPLNWSKESIRLVVSKLCKGLDVCLTSEPNAVIVKYIDRSGPDVQLRPNRSCFGWERRDQSIPAKRLKMFPSKPLHPISPLYDDPDMWYSSSAALGKCSFRKHPSWCMSQSQPRRDIGRGIRLCTKAKNIGGFYGMYSLYLISPLHDSEIPLLSEIEHRVYSGGFGNDVLPSMLGPNIVVEMEMVFTSVSSSDIQAKEWASGYKIPPKMKICFPRTDLNRLITDKADLRKGFRVCHKSFYMQSDEDDVKQVEESWNCIGSELSSMCCWWKKEVKVTCGPAEVDVDAGGGQSLEHPDGNDSDDLVKKSLDCLGVEAIPEWTVNLRGTGPSTLASSPTHLQSHWPYLVLRWPTVIFNKCCRIPSEVESRKDPAVQIVMYQVGNKIGMVVYDRLFVNDIYIIDPPRAHQVVLMKGFQSQGAEEIAINLTFFSQNLCYCETPASSGEGIRRSIIFVDGNENQTQADDEFSLTSSEAQINDHATTTVPKEDVVIHFGSEMNEEDDEEDML